MSGHRLAAIMFADIVGYTSMMEDNEALALKFLKRYKASLEVNVSFFRGEIIQFYGDGCLAIFGSSVDAVKCARQLQKEFQNDPAIPVRIGLHAGEVRVEEANVFGNAVNIASRVESMGTPASILLSSSVRNQIKNHPEFELENMGRFAFKNVDESMSVFALKGEYLSIPDPQQMLGKGEKLKVSNSFKSIIRAASIGFLAMVVGAGIFWLFSNKSEDDGLLPAQILESRIAVIPFENKTGDESLDIVGDMAADWIIQGLMELDDIKVVSFDNVKDHIEYSSLEGPLVDFANRTGAEKLVTGRYYLSGEELIFQSQIVDVKSGDIEISLPSVRGNKASPSEIVNQLQQIILTSFAADADYYGPGISQRPPPHAAYQFFRQGRNNFAIDDNKMRELMNQSLAIDSTFFWPYIWMSISFTNMGNPTMADSTLRLVDQRIGVEKLNSLEKNWYYHTLALSSKDYRKAFEIILEILEKDPKQYLTNFEASRFSKYFNMPRKGVELGSYIDPADAPTETNFNTWWHRDYAHNLYRVGKYDEALNVSNHVVTRLRDRWNYYDRKAEVFIATNEGDSLGGLISEMEELKQNPNNILNEFLFIAERYGVKKDTGSQVFWAKKGIEWMKSQADKDRVSDINKGYAYYLSEEYNEALIYLENSFDTGGRSNVLLRRLGCTYVKMGKSQNAEDIAKLLGEISKKSNNSWLKMDQARIYSQMGEKEQAVSLIREAIKDYVWYTETSYRNDIMFVPLQGYEPFEEAVKPKG